MDTHKILVTYPMTESEKQTQKRIKAGLPLPHYSFTVSGNANGIPADEDKRKEDRK